MPTRIQLNSINPSDHGGTIEFSGEFSTENENRKRLRFSPESFPDSGHLTGEEFSENFLRTNPAHDSKPRSEHLPVEGWAGGRLPRELRFHTVLSSASQPCRLAAPATATNVDLASDSLPCQMAVGVLQGAGEFDRELRTLVVRIRVDVTSEQTTESSQFHPSTTEYVAAVGSTQRPSPGPGTEA